MFKIKEKNNKNKLKACDVKWMESKMLMLK